jgi:diguanylate cyclase (GGDEF)-like protein
MVETRTGAMNEEYPTEEYVQGANAGGTIAPRAGPADDLWRMAGMAVPVAPLLVGVIVHLAIGASDVLLGSLALASVALLGAGFLLMRSPQETLRDPEAVASPLAGVMPAATRRGEPAIPPEILASLPADPLTGLPTFQPFSQRLLEEFHHVKRSGGQAAIVLIDINHLSRINEQFGPEAGDKVLLHVSQCLDSTKRLSDLLARMGDDEFALLLTDCDAPGARVYIQRVHERLARDAISLRRGERSTPLWVGICAGMAVCDPHAVDADEVLTSAVDDLNGARVERDRRRQRWEHSA